MSLRTMTRGDVVVVSPAGMLLGGDETVRLEQELRGLIARGQKKILLDLGRTTYLGSTAIGTLVRVHVSARKNGVAFFVCNIDKKNENILAIFKLINVLNVFPTREEALQALAKVDLVRLEKLAQEGGAQLPGEEKRGSRPPGDAASTAPGA